jgi:alpha-D-ribose 1-methylphosphonate 5-triphosphate diphosphatase PhnM
MSKKGAHQLAFRRRSVNVLLGATNVFRMRAGSDSGAVSATEAGAGGTGIAAIENPSRSFADGF